MLSSPLPPPQALLAIVGFVTLIGLLFLMVKVVSLKLGGWKEIAERFPMRVIHPIGIRYGKRMPARRWEEIFPWLHDNKYPSAKLLAKELEVTPKIIRRDMNDMRESRGLPIAFDYSRKGLLFHPVGEPVSGNGSDAERIADAGHDQQTTGCLHGDTVLQAGDDVHRESDEAIDGPDEKAKLELLRRCIYIRPYGVELVDPERFEWISL